MKKVIIAIAIAIVAVASNAASFKWSAANIYSPTDSTVKLSSGTAALYCDALSSDPVSTVSVASGAIAATTFDVNATANQSYTFYFVITTETAGETYTFTSASKTVTASDVGAVNIAFGNQANATQSASNWKGGSVPEPTTGLLVILGMAGLALKRKVA